MLGGWLLRINLDEGIECVDDRKKVGRTDTTVGNL